MSRALEAFRNIDLADLKTVSNSHQTHHCANFDTCLIVIKAGPQQKTFGFQSDNKTNFTPIMKDVRNDEDRPDTTCKSDYCPSEERDAGAAIGRVCPQQREQQGSALFN